VKQQLSIRNILLLTMGLLSLLVAVFTLQQVFQESEHMRQASVLRDSMLLADRLFVGVGSLSTERDATYLLLQSRDADVAANLSRDLAESRKAVDAGLRPPLDAVAARSLPGLGEALRDTLGRLKRLEDLRRDADRALTLPPDKRDPKVAAEWFTETTETIRGCQALWTSFTEQYSGTDARVALHIQLKAQLGAFTETVGEERALIGRLLAESAAETPDDQARLLRWQGAEELSWGQVAELARQGALLPAAAPALGDARSQYLSWHGMVNDLFYAPGVPAQPPYPISADLWLELTTQATESLYSLKDAVLAGTQAYIDGLEAAAGRAIMLRLLVLGSALALCFTCFRIVTRRVLQPIHEIVEALLGATQGRIVSVAPAAAARGDEIGALARVLQSLQKTLDDMRRSNRDLARSNKELDDFAYIASHDLREPLRGIHNHSRFLLEDNEGKLDEESLSRIKRLLYLSQRIERLVNDLLYFSRLGRQELAMQPTDMNEVVRDIESTIDEFLKQHRAKISIPRGLPSVTCDKTRVTEALRNLIVNAVKYNGNVERLVEIGFLGSAIAKQGRRLQDVFYVKDNGRGIAPEFHEDIFRIFRRLQANQPGEEEGTGVGLTFVKKIVERHGGRIWLDSAPGAGTTFYFTLHEEEKAQDDGKAAA
jgi:signal transduction histidine kinase